MQNPIRIVAAGFVLATLGTAASAAAGSIVGQWTCSYPATPASGALQSVYVINANGTWQMQMVIAPTQNLAGSMVRAQGTYRQTGADSATLISSGTFGSADGANWMPMPPQQPLAAQVQGDGLNIGGIVCHRGG
jgi:hypothetical protein